MTIYYLECYNYNQDLKKTFYYINLNNNIKIFKRKIHKIFIDISYKIWILIKNTKYLKYIYLLILIIKY